MNSSTNPSQSAHGHRLFTIAVWLTALSLLVAPFRSSAGLRAAALLVAAAILLVLWWQTKVATIRMPRGKFLRSSLAIWLVTVLVYSLFSADPRVSLDSWRGNVLTPMLAALVCYSLARSVHEVGVWLAALLCGLLILAGMVVLDPFQPVTGLHEPRYVSVGWLSTWVVMLAALLPLAWLLRVPRALALRSAGAIAAGALLTAAWFSGNRIVWLCFGVMFLLYMAMNFRQLGGKTISHVALMVIGVLVAAVMFYASSAMRASQFPTANVDAVSILQQDDRQTIWKAALSAIAERPITGHGYALAASHDALVRQFNEPGFQRMFRQAHNVVLNYAIQMGIPGAVALLLLFAGLVHAFWVRRTSSAFARGVATCGLMLLAGFFLRNMADDFFHRHGALLLGALIGMLLAACDWQSGADELHPVQTRV